MFTQRHFIAIAATIKARKELEKDNTPVLAAQEALEGLAWDFVELFEEDNELFKVKLFIRACGFSEDYRDDIRTNTDEKTAERDSRQANEDHGDNVPESTAESLEVRPGFRPEL